MMPPKKEPVEIHCPECGTGFRLWIPAHVLSEWEKGSRISCIKCGAQYLIRKDARKGFEVVSLKKAAAAAPAPAKPAAAKQAPAPSPSPAPAVKAPLKAPAIKATEPPEPEAQGAEAVLIVDDDRLAREMVQHSLKDIGIRLISTKNSTEALRILRSENISLIVTDLYLRNPADPDSQLDGEDLLKKVQASGLTVPAIITTGKDIIDDIVLDPKWYDLRVKGFIQKGNPFWAEELKLKIKEVMYKD
ncbi:MAG: response regulator [Deltaproteobacteria bacterium]|nr:response regulator [Deltaproteobacteria bacterium]